jgi:hypothetical protein
LIPAARDYWSRPGLTAEQQTLLNQLGESNFQIANLDASQRLGEAHDTLITLDDDAAGWGWFVDASPGESSSEFQWVGGQYDATLVTDSAAKNKMDLLTVMVHELGHVLGFSDLDSAAYPNSTSLMRDELPKSIRRLPGRSNGGPEVFQWAFPDSGPYYESDKWLPVGVPGPLDMVIIDRPNVNVAVCVSGSVTVNSIHLADELNVFDGNLTIVGNSEIAGTGTDTGSLTVGSAGTLTMMGGLAVTGNLTINGGTLSGHGVPRDSTCLSCRVIGVSREAAPFLV